MTAGRATGRERTPIRLHLGCGLNAPPDWINVDASWNAWLAQHRILRRCLKASRLLPAGIFEVGWPANVLIHDLRRGLPFADGTVEAIYSSNMLEHLYLSDARRLLGECFRVLQPLGVLRIVVPDLAAIVREYCANENQMEDVPATRRADRATLRLNMYPTAAPEHLLERVYRGLLNPYHKWNYDAESMIAYFREAGFTGIESRRPLESRIANLSSVERPEHWTLRHDLCVEGVKP